METINGVPVIDQMIQALADEAELGYDLDALCKRGRQPKGDGQPLSPQTRDQEALLE